MKDIEALAYAREIFTRRQHEEVEVLPGIRALWLDKESNRRVVIDLMKQFAQWRPENLMDIVHYAREGWGIADEALRELLLDHINSGTPVPTYLAAYNMDIVAGGNRKIRARQKADLFLRDMAIVTTTLMVMEKFNLPPTGRNTSACSVVAEALGAAKLQLGYKAVENIWLRYGKMVTGRVS